MSKPDMINQLAELGAGIRLHELAVEQALIVKAFPRLTDAPVQTVNSRQHMSAAQRQQVSVRMKRYWAERRKSKRNAQK